MTPRELVSFDFLYDIIIIFMGYLAVKAVYFRIWRI